MKNFIKKICYVVMISGMISAPFVVSGPVLAQYDDYYSDYGSADYYSDYASSDYFSDYGSSNYFSDYADSGYFSDYADSNYFSDYASSDYFSDYIDSNYFSDYNDSNYFSDYNDSNYFSDYADSNYFSDYNDSNYFSDYNDSNYFSDYADSNYFSDYADSNYFSDYADSNYFSDYNDCQDGYCYPQQQFDCSPPFCPPVIAQRPVPIPTPIPTPRPIPIPVPRPVPVSVPRPIITPVPVVKPVVIPVVQPVPTPVPVPQPYPVPTPVPTPIPTPISQSGTLAVNKLVRNVSDGERNFSNLTIADPGEVVEFLVEVINNSRTAPTGVITLIDQLPPNVSFRDRLRVDGNPINGNITGLQLGILGPGQKRTVMFEAIVAGPANFKPGETELVNTAIAKTPTSTDSGFAKIIVRRGLPPTNIPTGLTDNILFDSFALPLAFAGLGLWLFKSRIIKMEEWIDTAKESHRDYKAEKLLNSKIANIKSTENL